MFYASEIKALKLTFKNADYRTPNLHPIPKTKFKSVEYFENGTCLIYRTDHIETKIEHARKISARLSYEKCWGLPQTEREITHN